MHTICICFDFKFSGESVFEVKKGQLGSNFEVKKGQGDKNPAYYISFELKSCTEFEK